VVQLVVAEEAHKPGEKDHNSCIETTYVLQHIQAVVQTPFCVEEVTAHLNVHYIFNVIFRRKVKRRTSLHIGGLGMFWSLEEIAVVVYDAFKLHVERVHQRCHHVEGQPFEVERLDERFLAEVVGLEALRVVDQN